MIEETTDTGKRSRSLIRVTLFGMPITNSPTIRVMGPTSLYKARNDQLIVRIRGLYVGSDPFVASEPRPVRADAGCHLAAPAKTRPSLPGVINVSQEDAQAYAAWLSTQTGKRYRLPTEAEWEYAARSGTSTRYSWGDGITCNQARYGRRSNGECSDSYDGTVAVGSFAVNLFGLHDMQGNVREWVEDCYGDYADAPTDGSARTGCDEALAVLRGGCWYFGPRLLRSADRDWLKPSSRLDVAGFRLVRDISP